MCDPLTIGLALSAGGALGKQVSARRQANAIDDATNDALQAELLRQDEFDRERQGLLGDILQNTAGRAAVDEGAAEAEAERIAAQQENRQLPTENEGSFQADGTTPRIVQSRQDTRRSENEDVLDQEAQARARLSGLGDVLTSFARQRQPNVSELQNSQQFARQSAAILPSEIRQAQIEASDTGRFLDLASTLASVAGTGFIGAGAGGKSFADLFGAAETAAGATNAAKGATDLGTALSTALPRARSATAAGAGLGSRLQPFAPSAGAAFTLGPVNFRGAFR